MQLLHRIKTGIPAAVYRETCEIKIPPLFIVNVGIRRRHAVPWLSGTAWIHQINAVAVFVAANVGVSVQDDVTVLSNRFFYQNIGSVANRMAVSMHGKDAMPRNQVNGAADG